MHEVSLFGVIQLMFHDFAGDILGHRVSVSDDVFRHPGGVQTGHTASGTPGRQPHDSPPKQATMASIGGLGKVTRVAPDSSMVPFPV